MEDPAVVVADADRVVPPAEVFALEEMLVEVRALDSTLETTMVLTSNAGGILQNSEDAKEARRAFVEKRKGNFRGV